MLVSFIQQKINSFQSQARSPCGWKNLEMIMMRSLSRQHLSQVVKPAPGIVLSSFTISECWKVKQRKICLFEASYWHLRETFLKWIKLPKVKNQRFSWIKFGMKFSSCWPSSRCAAYSVLQMVRNWNAAKLPPSLAPAMFICKLSALHGTMLNAQFPRALVGHSCLSSSPVCALPWDGCVSRRETAQESAPNALSDADFWILHIWNLFSSLCIWKQSA